MTIQLQIQASALGDFLSANVSSHRSMYVILVIAIAAMLLIGFDWLVQLFAPKVTKKVDIMTTARNVLQIRRAETFAGLAIAIFRLLIFLAALFLIWHIASPHSGPAALIGVGTIIVILAGATIVPLLRDMTYGFIMITERWYNVGDHVVIEPFGGSGGVVERMTLRSTKIRRVNGEAMWVHHQNVMAVHVTSTVSHPIIVETFVNDPVLGRKIVEDAAKVIPTGATTVPQPLSVTEVKKLDEKIWRVTAICEVTPFREWMIDNFAVEAIRKTDELTGKPPVVVHGPISYYADPTAEKRFRRSASVRQRLRNKASV